MTEWWHVSWKRVGVTLLVIFLTPLLLYGAWRLVVFQFGPWAFARFVAAPSFGMNMVPTFPADKSVAHLSGDRIERFGFTIQLPWKEIALDRTFSNTAFLTSKSDAVIEVRSPSGSFDSAKSMRDWANGVPALQEESLRTNYALVSAVMAEKPEQVKWWRTPGQNARDLNLLIRKYFDFQHCGALYSVNFGEVRGIQQGSPAVAPYDVKLDLFDSADKHYEITMGPRMHDRPVVTQAEINAMVASLRPISQK